METPSYIHFLLIFFNFSFINGDVAIQCPNINPKYPFDISQFLGVWYQIARISNLPSENIHHTNLTTRPLLESCIRLVLNHKEDGNIRIERSGLNENGKLIIQLGEAEQHQVQRAMFHFEYPGEFEEDLAVIEANYEEHALLYGCHLTISGHVRHDAWILGRDLEIPTISLDILKGILRTNNINLDNLIMTRQDELCKIQNPDNTTRSNPSDFIGV